MSSIITGILNSTIGLLWNKARDLTAAELQHGDITDVKIRKIVVRELNDINTKLDGLSRKDLLTSYRFLKEGVELLNVSLDEWTQSTQEHCGEPSRKLNDVESTILNEVLELTRAVGKIKNKSCAEYELAKEGFKDARKKATEAFCNEALGVGDRIFAAKLRVVSGILENLESPKTAIIGCLSFLRELHSLPDIREIFSVYLNGGVKSLLGKEERVANVKSIMLINYVLFQFTFKFGSEFTDRVLWPAGIIDLADRSFNTVLEWQKVSSRKSMRDELGEPPIKQLLLSERRFPWFCAVNSRGEIVVKHSDDEIKIIFKTVKCKVVKLPEPKEVKRIMRRILGLCVDNSNELYVVSYRTTRTATEVIVTYELHVLDDRYNVKQVGTLDFLVKIDGSHFMNIAVNENKDIVITRDNDNTVYVADNSGKLKHKFERDSRLGGPMSISDKNEIMISSRENTAFNFYTEDGNLTSTIKLPEGHRVCRLIFHYVVGKVIALTRASEKDSCFLLCYSETGELESSTFFCEFFDFQSITSHPGGPVAVVKRESITFI